MTRRKNKTLTTLWLEEEYRYYARIIGHDDITRGIKIALEEAARERGIWIEKPKKKPEPHLSARVKLFVDSLKNFDRLTFHVDELHKIMLGIGIRKAETRAKILRELEAKGILSKENGFRFRLMEG